jgi:hypothetical protein
MAALWSVRRLVLVRRLLLVLGLVSAAGMAGAANGPEYSIVAIRLADSPGDQVAEMVMGAPPDERIDSIYALWLIRGAGRNILFDSGFHRERWFKEWTIRIICGQTKR